MPQGNPMTDTQLESIALDTVRRWRNIQQQDNTTLADVILAALKSVRDASTGSPSPPLVEPVDAANRKSTSCKCGAPHDGWPGSDGGELCQMCWEAQCSGSWWRYCTQAEPPLPICGTNTERKGSEGLPDSGLSFDQKAAKQEFE